MSFLPSSYSRLIDTDRYSGPYGAIISTKGKKITKRVDIAGAEV
jgi:hypothetical protein